MSAARPMSYERRLLSYGLRDDGGPTSRRATGPQLRRIRHKNWNRPQRPATRGAEPATVIRDEAAVVRTRWTIDDIFGPRARPVTRA